MVVQENQMSAYMSEHQCPTLLIQPEIEAAKHGQLVHWRDLNGHWFSAIYQAECACFEVHEG